MHTKSIAQRSYDYNELPHAIYDEFISFTHGVVSNIFLKSITAIRANTYFLLDTFQRDIDPAFMAHKGLLPTPDDAHEHIIEIIGSEIKSVIGGALDENITNSLVNTFIDSLDEKHLLLNIEDKESLPHSDTIPDTFSINKFKELLDRGLISFCEYENDTVRTKIELSQKAIKALPKTIIKSTNPSLNNSIVSQKANQSNIKFAKLTTIRKRYLNFSKPILALGVILKGTTVSGKDEYWICIQPKCDSVRLSDSENLYQGRPFMFLSLTKKTTNGDIVLDTKIGFKIEYNIIKAKQFMFRPTKSGTVSVLGDSITKWYFIDSFGRRFEYLGELKNDFAQDIANNFAT